MLGLIKKLGTSGSVGAIVGVGLVVWIEPTTNAGIGLIIAVSVLASVVVGAALSPLFRKEGKTRNSSDE